MYAHVLVDRIKAMAFPVLVAVVIFFGKRLVDQQDKIIEQLQRIEIDAAMRKIEIQYLQDKLYHDKENTR